MRDRDLYSKILGTSAPWHVTEVLLDVPAGKVEVVVEYRGGSCCLKCGEPCSRYDKRRRRQRHLDTCQFETHLVAEVPRVSSEEHGVVQVSVRWAEGGSLFTRCSSRW